MGGRLTDRERMQREIREAELQDTINDALTFYGYQWFHDRAVNFAHQNNAGFPDVVAAHPTTGWMVVLELKRQVGALSQAQWDWLMAFRGAVPTSALASYSENPRTAIFLNEVVSTKRVVGICRPSNLDGVLAALRRASGRS